MEDFYRYTLLVNAGLVVFYLLYSILYSRDTFFTLRRWLLVAVVGMAFAYPGVTLSGWIGQDTPLPVYVAEYTGFLTAAAGATAAGVTAALPQAAAPGWREVAGGLWMAGSLALAGLMLWRLLVLARLIAGGKKICCRGQRCIVAGKATEPFSFFGWIVLKPGFREESGWEDIVAHESVHVRQWHSLDILMGELLCVFFWFNPVAWLLRREIRRNLEFLADREVVRNGCDRRAYQYHLLHLTCRRQGLPLVNNFNVLPLKKRIIMMNRKSTARRGLIKYALLLPVTGMLILSANAEVLREKITTDRPVLSRDGAVQVGGTPDVTAGDEKTPVIRGKVVDEKGEPVQGASVIVRNSTQGACTAADGTFELTGHEKATVVFSYVGKEGQILELSASDRPVVVKMVTCPQQLEKVVVTAYDPNSKVTPVYVVVEEMPRFPGGSPQSFIARQVKYPVEAAKLGMEGEIVVSFVVDKTGKVTEPEIVKGIHKDLDREVLRVVKAMPVWEPGKQRGKAVDVRFILPVEFRLVKKE